MQTVSCIYKSHGKDTLSSNPKQTLPIPQRLHSLRYGNRISITYQCLKGEDIGAPPSKANGPWIQLQKLLASWAGVLGEMTLPTAVLWDNLEAAMVLMEAALELTALHVAIMNQNVNLPLQHYLLWGAPFCPLLPVSSEEIMRLLIEHGTTTWPNKTFTCQMYKLLLSYHGMLHHQGLTPFKLAGVEGNTGEDLSFLELMVSLRKKEQVVSFRWKKRGQWYFCVSGALYPLYTIYNTIFQQKPLQETYVAHQDKIWFVRELVILIKTVVILFLEILGIFSVSASCYLGQTACLVLVNMRMWFSNMNGEMVPVSVALVLGWCGMIFGDLKPFCQLITEYPANLGQVHDYPVALFNTLQLFLTIIESLPTMNYFAFAIIATLLMLNLFITIKDDTQRQMAKMVILERKLPCSGIHKNNHGQNPLRVLLFVEAFKGSNKEHEQEQLSEKQPSVSGWESLCHNILGHVNLRLDLGKGVGEENMHHL
ncbi:unnamed protein product [Nyctereutes procyonoides]|uniref:(raccoon dog) hypothetical protein n=1 Tax=Nyctereutes procyonoides TaxID=34880 RepID=A0A811Z877_NYCPR|nr:unnamed protein product [Nyctereutes procyonoides]